MKKIFTSLFIISSIFATITFAEDIEKVCADKMDICMEKCVENAVKDCEDTCYEKYDSCFNQENDKLEKSEEN